MSDFAQLSFVTRKPCDRLDLWTPERPEGYAAGCEKGREYAAELLTYMRATGDSAVFGGVLRAITRSGVYEAVEVGFCMYFGVALLGVEEGVEAVSLRDAA